MIFMLDQQKKIQLVKGVINALNTGDVSKVSDFVSPTYFNHESQMDPVRSKMRGPEEFIDTVRNIRKAFSDLYYEEKEILASDNKIHAVVNVTGKHTGSFFDFIPPSGNRISYMAVHIFTIGEDGKISEHKAIRDDLALMYQLGVVRSAGTQYDQFIRAWKGTGS